MHRIILLIIFVFICINLTGCVVYQAGGAKIYEAMSSTDDGKKFVEQWNIKYLCPDVYGIFWSDFYRSDCKYVVDILEDKDGNIQYKTLQKEMVVKLGLVPRFSVWDTYGMWIVLVLVPLAFWIYIRIREALGV